MSTQSMLAEFDEKCHIETGGGGFLTFPFAVKANKYKPAPFLNEIAIKSFLAKAIETAREEEREKWIREMENFRMEYEHTKIVYMDMFEVPTPIAKVIERHQLACNNLIEEYATAQTAEGEGEHAK